MEEYFMKITELLNDLDIDYMQISSIRYDDNKGTSYFTNEMLSAGFKILNDEAIEISSGSKFIGAFDFTKYKIYRDNEGVILEDKKSRYLEIYLK
jgi:hypothetical protein